MSFKADLVIDQSQYPVRQFSFNISQKSDMLGRSLSKGTGGILNVEIDTVEDQTIHTWMINPDLQLDCSLILANLDQSSPLKKIELKNAYCISLREHFHSSGYTSFSISISPEKLIIGDVKINNLWTDPKKS